MSLPLRRLVASIAAGSFCCCVATAQTASSLAEAAASGATTTLAQALEAAWQHRRVASTSQDRVRRANASALAARSWLPNAPAIEATVRSDRWHGNSGAQERELGVRLPLWLPGQRDARIAAAQADQAWAEAAAAVDRLKLAGEVRERAWEVVAARALQRQADEQAQSLKALADDVARRMKAGDLARADLLEVMAESLAAEQQEQEAHSRLASAQAQWAALTSLADVPDPAEAQQEGAAIGDEVPASHPALRLAELAVERAERALDSTRRSSREAPELGVGLRQDRAEFGQSMQNTIGISLRWTLGTDARNEPLRAAALGELEVARADALVLRQQLAGECAATSAALSAAQAQLLAAGQRAKLLQQRAELIDAAFKAGEVGLPVFLRAREASAQSATALTRQEAAVGLAQARLRQALGLLP